MIRRALSLAKTSASIGPSDTAEPPDEPGPVGEKGKPAGRPAVHEPNGDRRFARTAGMNLAVDRDLGAGGVADIIGGLARDVAGRAVVEVGGDDELLVETAPGARNPFSGEDYAAL